MRPYPTHAVPTVLLLLAALLGATAPASAQTEARDAARSARMAPATTGDLAAQLRDPSGTVRITVLYGVRCSNSQAMFEDLGPLTRRFSGRVEFVAYNQDRRVESIASVPLFLKRYGARVESRWLQPWDPGELIAAVGSIGVPMESRYTLPVVIIQDQAGELLWSGEGVRSLEGLDRWLDQATR